MAGHVAVVTCRRARGLDTDEPLLLAALDRLGLRVHVVDWDRPADWSDYDVAVIRSTWNYAGRHAEFLSWAAATGAVTQLHNPAAVLTWNTDKRYLSQLSQAGLAVIETTFLPPGSRLSVTELSRPIVVKPSVSAGGQDTARYEPDQLRQASDHVDRLHAEQRTAMVQPYLEAVEADDETALVYIGGEFSHAAAKGALLGAGAAQAGLFAAETITARLPSAAERALGDATMAWLAGSQLGTPLYARIDLLLDADGLPRILEVELTEPSLFLETDAAAADRMAVAIQALSDLSPLR
ncbi:MAG: ATP-grasp domain-containing protein [Geodermatophilaceae bacterium]